jgi:enoyl-CoA hydratase/carnithine racemase
MKEMSNIETGEAPQGAAEPKVLVSTPSPHVLLITLNRPDVLNAIDIQLAVEVDAILKAAATDNSVRVIVMTGAGSAFSAGYDIHEMNRFDGASMVGALIQRSQILWRIAKYPKPIIAALNGVTYGAGALIAAAADIRIGGPEMKFRVTATMYGGANATWSLPHIVGVAKAKEILMTGRAVLAEEALSIGLLNHLVPTAEVLSKALGIAGEIASNPPPGVDWVKMLINEGIGRRYEEQFNSETLLMIAARDHQPGVSVFSKFLSKGAKSS